MEEHGSDEAKNKSFSGLRGSRKGQLQSTFVNSLPTEICGKHPSEYLNMFCYRERSVCCTVCIALEHKLCDGQVVYIKTAATDVVKSKEYSDVQANLNASLQSLTKINSERQLDRARLTKEKEQAHNEIEEFKSKIQKQVELLADNALNEVDRRNESLNENIVTDLVSIHAMIGRIKTKMIELQKASNECELFTSVIRSQYLTKECDIFDTFICTHIGQEKITVKEDKHLNDTLSLKINIVRFIDVNPPSVSIDKARLLCAELTKEIVLKDKIPNWYCDIEDVCCLENGNIAVTDKYNYKVWILDSSLEVSFGHKLKGNQAIYVQPRMTKLQ